MSARGHRLAEERSLLLHRAVAEALPLEPAIVERAKMRVQQWLESGPTARPYALEWQRVLEGDLPRIQAALIDQTERGRALRQTSPFAGALPARERWRLLRESTLR